MYYANDRMPRRIAYLHNTHRPPSQYVAGERGGGGGGGIGGGGGLRVLEKSGIVRESVIMDKS